MDSIAKESTCGSIIGRMPMPRAGSRFFDGDASHGIPAVGLAVGDGEADLGIVAGGAEDADLQFVLAGRGCGGDGDAAVV